MELFWLKDISRGWLKAISQNRSPHAVLLNGKKGVGKRSFASWISRLKLNLDPNSSLPVYPLIEFKHPDMHPVSPIEEGKSIGIDQIRFLERELNLTSHGSSGKVAIIEPANNMTVNAANGLLKLLEEPTDNTLLILISDSFGKLPATILSRCHQINIPLPSKDVSLQWLNSYNPNVDYTKALEIAKTPISSIRAIEKIEATQQMLDDLQNLQKKRVSVIEIASRWSKLETNFVLNWMSEIVMQLIKEKMVGKHTSNKLSIDYSFLDRAQNRDLFNYLENINKLNSKPSGSYNNQLAFEALLIDWSNYLSRCRPPSSLDGMELMLESQ